MLIYFNQFLILWATSTEQRPLRRKTWLLRQLHACGSCCISKFCIQISFFIIFYLAIQKKTILKKFQSTNANKNFGHRSTPSRKIFSLSCLHRIWVGHITYKSFGACAALLKVFSPLFSYFSTFFWIFFPERARRYHVLSFETSIGSIEHTYGGKQFYS